ncbi:MAG TPA: hypothetical protein VFZ10_06105 [Geminicoccaceae bacterium]
MGKTTVDIDSGRFLINGRVTYPGRRFRGHRIEGLLLNARMVQGVFDDLNPETRSMFAYPDGPFDAERNTREFVAAMPSWRSAGLLAFTVNFQGGSPQGYSSEQRWHNSAFEADGHLRPDYAARMARIVERADELGMVVILGFFYFGQDQRLTDEAAVVAAVANATEWLIGRGYRNVIVEIANEIDVPRYTHQILKPDRCHELIEVVQRLSAGRVANRAGRLLVGTSYRGGSIPRPNVVGVADVLFLHGNHIDDAAEIRLMVRETRALPDYRGQPIVFNEDDHFDFDRDDSNFMAAVAEGASWGLFDYRLPGEGPECGFQSVPVDWRINTPRKRAFFNLVAEMTGSAARF